MPYKHKISPRLLDEDTHEPLPEPYERLHGVKIHSPRWGNGWLGIDRVSDLVVIWHVNEDSTSQPLDFDTVQALVDPRTGNIWMVFTKETGQSYPFLLFPDEAIGIGYVPDVVKKLLDGGEHER